MSTGNAEEPELCVKKRFCKEAHLRGYYRHRQFLEILDLFSQKESTMPVPKKKPTTESLHGSTLESSSKTMPEQEDWQASSPPKPPFPVLSELKPYLGKAMTLLLCFFNKDKVVGLTEFFGGCKAQSDPTSVWQFEQDGRPAYQVGSHHQTVRKGAGLSRLSNFALSEKLRQLHFSSAPAAVSKTPGGRFFCRTGGQTASHASFTSITKPSTIQALMRFSKAAARAASVAPNEYPINA